MAEVKWIKITTDMFDNRKIKHLRRLPDGNNIVLIWVMLLTLAGRCNSGGMIFLTENIPYTPKMLADELDFEESTVTLALQALERLGMVSTTTSGFINLPGWEGHQNIEGLDKIREQTRKRVADYRTRKKQALLSDDSNVTVTDCNAADKDTDKDIDKEKEEDISLPAEAPTKTKRFSPPSVEDVAAYCQERENGIDADAFVDYYSARNWTMGKTKMKDWKAAVRTWERNRKGGGSNAYGRPEDNHCVTGDFGTVL